MSVTREHPRPDPHRQATGDAALWTAASSSESAEVFANAWLALLGRSQPAIVQAVLFLDADGLDQPNPVAWQALRASGTAPRETFEAASRHLLGMLESDKSPLVDFKQLHGEHVLGGWPVVIDGKLAAAIIVVEAAVSGLVSLVLSRGQSVRNVQDT